MARVPVRAKSHSSLFTVRFYRGDDGFVVASCPKFPGCVSQGKTLAEARSNIREAMGLYWETLAAVGTRPKTKARRRSGRLTTIGDGP